MTQPNNSLKLRLDARKPVFGDLQATKAKTRKLSKLVTSKISIFKLVTVAEETCLSLDESETTKTGFVLCLFV